MDSNKDKLHEKFDVDLTPFKNFMEQMDSFFNESFKQMNSFFNLRPFQTRMYEIGSDVIVEADLPGYKREQINIEAIDKQLRISVHERETIEEKDDINDYYSKSLSHQQMERYVTLPFVIPEHQAKASYNDGVLKITIPKGTSKKTYIEID